MLLPNKLFSYESTALPLLPKILRILDEPMTPKRLSQQIDPFGIDPVKIIDALDCLYALGRIALNDEGKLHRC